jgi:hypothetical protein
MTGNATNFRSNHGGGGPCTSPQTKISDFLRWQEEEEEEHGNDSSAPKKTELQYTGNQMRFFWYLWRTVCESLISTPQNWMAFNSNSQRP